ncbi:MAG: hypothetical protein RMK19_06585 [Bacteroidia bacterium]|nr:hypothetical protein [Bacteroidia bacterium]MDW8015661.1 hypothetical protein [Bacteroidia bacterium]
MKKVVPLSIGTIAFLLMVGCGSTASVTKNDTYFSAQDRTNLKRQSQSPSTSSEVDSRSDNYESEERPSRRENWEDDDYCYSCRIRRYSAGVWYYDPCWNGWQPWGWRSAWWGPGWMAAPGWYYTPGWGWTYYGGYWWGPTYFAGPGWYDYGWGVPAPTRRPTYMPRTYTTPRGSTIYTPPRSPVPTSSTPSRRTAAPSSGGGRSLSSPAVSPSTGARPGMPSGSTGGIRTSSGVSRPR